MSALSTLRLLIADVDPTDPILTDAQVGDFLTMHGIGTPSADADIWIVRRAAAEALDAIATSEVLVSKVIRTQDLSTDGAKVATELRAQADRLRSRADAEEDATYDAAGFSVIEFQPWR